MEKYTSQSDANSLIAKLKHWIRQRKIKNTDIDSTGATAGQVPTADGSGGTSWTTPSAGMTNPMTTAGDIIVGGSSGTPARLANGTAGNLLRAGTNGPEYSNALPYLTTAPSADNTDGIKIVVLSQEPSSKYNGYLYFVLASNS